MILLWAALSMAARDALGCLLTISEARGRAVLAGTLDAALDGATIFVTIFGAGEIIVHGWTLKSIEILLVIMFTSFWGTLFWTKVGAKLIPKD
jgi:hypothetical protein